MTWAFITRNRTFSWLAFNLAVWLPLRYKSVNGPSAWGEWAFWQQNWLCYFLSYSKTGGMARRRISRLWCEEEAWIPTLDPCWGAGSLFPLLSVGKIFQSADIWQFVVSGTSVPWGPCSCSWLSVCFWSRKTNKQNLCWNSLLFSLY